MINPTDGKTEYDRHTTSAPSGSGSPTPDSPENQLFDEPNEIAGETAVYGQWKLMWLKFRKHKLALIGAVLVGIFYLIAIFAEFIAPQLPTRYDRNYPFAPPQRISLIVSSDDGYRFQPHVNGYRSEVDPASFRRTFTIDDDEIIPIGFFVEGSEYRMWGLFSMNRRLFGTKVPGAPMYLLGTDHLGRDLFTRMVYGARVSMTIGLVGVTLSLILGVILGGVSGYFGGWVDNIIQRIIEFLQSIPAIPLWMGLAAAIPQHVDPLLVYFLITVILSVLGWTGLARVVRGKFYALKIEDFVVAARVDGVSNFRIIMRHMVPSFLSHIIATVTLAVPLMIIAETSLSFLGLGLRAPVVSWGVLLQQAQSVRVVATAPWLLVPGIAVIFAVLGFNFLGDGMRDAADPYSN